MVTQGRALARLTAITFIGLMLACGGGSSPNSPSPLTTGSPGPSGATITIANGQVSPHTVQIEVGQSVTFVNNDNRARQISSDPHPTHTDCPAINALGNIGVGQTRLTDALTSARTCGFHDHNDPDNPNVRGTIEIR